MCCPWCSCRRSSRRRAAAPPPPPLPPLCRPCCLSSAALCQCLAACSCPLQTQVQAQEEEEEEEGEGEERAQARAALSPPALQCWPLPLRSCCALAAQSSTAMPSSWPSTTLPLLCWSPRAPLSMPSASSCRGLTMAAPAAAAAAAAAVLCLALWTGCAAAGRSCSCRAAASCLWLLQLLQLQPPALPCCSSAWLCCAACCRLRLGQERMPGLALLPAALGPSLLCLCSQRLQ